MKTKFNKIVMLFIIFVSPYSQAGLDWDTFLESPSKKKFLNLEKNVKYGKHCASGVEFMTRDQYKKLYNLVEQRNEHALVAGMKFIGCMGVADAEDFDRVAGVFFEQRPERFLNIASDIKMDTRHLKSILIMLPEETVDNFAKQAAILELRLEKLNSVKDSKLKKIKSIGIEVLNEELKEVRRIESKDKKK